MRGGILKWNSPDASLVIRFWDHERQSGLGATGPSYTRYSNHYGRSRSKRQLIQRTIDLRFNFWGSFWVFQKIKISD